VKAKSSSFPRRRFKGKNVSPSAHALRSKKSVVSMVSSEVENGHPGLHKPLNEVSLTMLETFSP
jgi:hypothetical protein